MGLSKSKGPSDVPSSSIQKSKNKSQSKYVDRQSTSSRPSMISNASSSYGSVKTPMKSPRNINETDLASDSRGRRSEPKKFLIPQIVITRASTETIHTLSPEDDTQRTIKDKTDYGPYYRHRNPSTVDAYTKTEPERPKPKSLL
ncbi:spermatogenesis-associated protein 33 [Trichosurus vulpecula]|uniref:spermatogenesis-associated protein 33 n=1 Tax=Trichosurus vulpecula TaxID=9337 RepID=UPI00186AC8A6|nr:spermatogenesis-associated protein 33 [Trichosurus vulpecula]